MNERDIFLAALDITDPDARSTYLDEICGGKAALRASVDALFASHEGAGDFLEKSIVQPAGADSSADTAVDKPSAAIERTALLSPEQQTLNSENDKSAEDDEIPLGFLSPSTKPDSRGRLAHYEVVNVLGGGAFGTVLKAFDEKLHRLVAIKVMSAELASTSPARKRFLREARSAAAIRHDNVVAIHTVEEQPIPYLVMEYIPGRTLQQALDGQGPLEIPEVLRLGQQIASGLAAAHAQGLIHRDIKPANILLEDGIQWKVKISDFGLARAADDASVTQSGVIAGTPMYMSPEQAHTNQIDQRSDLFSFGSVMYQMTSGRPPFRAASTLAVLKRVTEDTPRPIQDIIPETPDWLCAIISKLHSKRPEDRYQTASEVAELLGRCQSELQLNGDVTCVQSSHYAPRDEPSATAPSPRNCPHHQPSSTSHTTPKDSSRRSKTVALKGSARLAMAAALANHGWWFLTGFIATLAMVTIYIVSRGNNNQPTQLASDGSQPSQENGTDPSVWRGWPPDSPPPAIAPFNTELAKQHQDAWAKYLRLPVEYTNSVGMRFVLIPPGEFTMGSTPTEIETSLNVAGEDKHWQECIKSEAPQHKVILTQPIYLGVNEVTQAEYETVMGTNPSHFAPLGAGKEVVVGLDTTRHPVEQVSWNDAAEFCAKLSQQEKLKPFYFRAGETIAPLDGTGYRLPSEAEWEHACRAGSTTKYWMGDKDEDMVLAGWFGGNSGVRTHGVGELKANPFGLSDVHGNVWEWVQDMWEPTYYGQFQEQPAINPGGPSAAGSRRVIRGGYWYLTASDCRSSFRLALDPPLRFDHVGFRVSLVVDAVKQALSQTPNATPDRAAAEWVLSIGGTIHITENGQERRFLGALGDLPRGVFELIGVNLSKNPMVSDAGLAHFKDCEHLTVVWLTATKVSDAGLAHFKDRTNLTVLQLGETKVSDAGLTHFKDCKNLTILGLNSSQVTDTGLAHFQGCMNLAGLDLSSTKVSDAGLAHFKDCKKLTWLGLTRTQVSDAGLAHFKDCKNLSVLYLGHSQVSDAGLAPLADCLQLGSVNVISTKVTEAGVKKLSAALPKCKIEWDGDVIEPTVSPDRTAPE